MNIQSTNPVFKAKYKTGRILEITTQKIFEPDGFEGFKETLKELNGGLPKYTGAKGFKYYAALVGEKITQKYPKIKEATEKILEIAKSTPYISPQELRLRVEPIIAVLGKTIDISV